MKKIIKDFFAVSIFLPFVLGLAKLPVVFAQAGGVVISQAQVSGGPWKTNEDFIEIFNPGNQDILLQGFSLVKRTAASTSKETILYLWEGAEVILSKHFYLLANPTMPVASPSSTPDIINAAIVIADNNGLAIKDTAGQILDSLSWGNTDNGFPSATTTIIKANFSLVRDDLYGNASAYSIIPSRPKNSSVSDVFLPPAEPALTSDTATTTASSTPEIITKSLKVKIYRFLPNPVGDDAGAEWVELKNLDSVEVNLTGWYLDDKNTGSGPATDSYILSGTIVAGEVKRFILPKEAFALNNSGGDEVNLYFADKAVAETVGYSAVAYDDGIFEFRDNIWQPPTLSTGGGGSSGSSSAASSVVSYLGTSQFKLNEIFANPAGDDAGGEWIEIYNSASATGSLVGFYLADGEGETWSSSAYLISTSTLVSPLGFVVVYLSKDSITLNNSGKEKVKLFNPQKQLVDKIEYADAPENRAWAKIQEGKWQYQIPTPGQDNSLVPELPKIIISEILPAPQPEQEEFIEFYNSATTTANLGGIVLKIGSKNKIFDFGQTLLPMSYLVLYTDDLPGALRNSGQEIALLDMYGRTIFSASYPKAKAGEAYAITEAGSFFWTGSPTPGETNMIVLSASTTAPVKITASPAVKTSTVSKSTADYTKLNKAYGNLELKLAMLEKRIDELSLNTKDVVSKDLSGNPQEITEFDAPKSSQASYKYLVLAGGSLLVLIGIGKKHLSGIFRKYLD